MMDAIPAYNILATRSQGVTYRECQTTLESHLKQSHDLNTFLCVWYECNTWEVWRCELLAIRACTTRRKFIKDLQSATVRMTSTTKYMLRIGSHCHSSFGHVTCTNTKGRAA